MSSVPFGDLPEPEEDESDSMDIVEPTRIIIDVADLTQMEIDYIIDAARSFGEVVGGSVVIRTEPIPEDGIEKEVSDDESESRNDAG